MTDLDDLIRNGNEARSHRPWPRAVVEPEAWSLALEQLAQGHWTMLDLWAETNQVHMALFEEASGAGAVISLDCRQGRYPSVARHHPPALRLERAIHDLFGIEPEGLPDPRPWLDHGRWDLRQPLAARAPTSSEAPPYAFLAAEGESLHQIAVGPVHAGIIEPGHFRFTANGETVVRLEERLGYVHRGVEGLMAGAELERATKLAGRISGDSTVAYSLAFARAVEAAEGLEVPARAHWLRALMAEAERMANHFGDIGAICNDASFALMHAHCGALREWVLRAADTGFGHRLMRDRVLPGGVAAELNHAGVAGFRHLLDRIRSRFPALVELYDNTASLQDRTVATGILKPGLARQYGAGGFVGRASGRAFDARRTPGYAPYDTLAFEVPTRLEGDVNARVWIRIHEIEQSLSLIERILDGLPDGPIQAKAIPVGEPREGLALVESFRGDVFAWLRLSGDGRVERCRLRDPSWFQWPLLEAVVEGNIVADFPLCNKSFNCSYAGHDL